MNKYFLVLLFFVLLMAGCGENLQRPAVEYTLDNPAAGGSRFPNFYQDSTGTVYMSWLTNLEEDIFMLQYSRYVEGTWSEPETIHLGTDYFVNWADFPSVVGTEGRAFAAHRLKKVEGGPYAYHVELAFRDHATGRWNTQVVPHLDNSPTEHGFVSLEPLSDESVLAVWLDGRNTEGRAHDEYENQEQAMTLRSAVVSSEGEITLSREIDGIVCDCCQTDMAATENGYSIIYRGRNADEIRDIKIAHYNAEEGQWSEPVYVHEDNWNILACPVNGPRLAANGSRMAVAWFTGADEQSRVKLARSTDSGQNFGDAIIIADSEQRPLGRADVLVMDNGEVFVSWLQQNAGNGDIMLTHVAADGTVLNSYRIGTTTANRNSGFPRMAATNDAIIIAWTQTEPIYRVRTAKFPL